MPRVKVGVGPELPADQTIQAWELVRAEDDLYRLVDKQLPKIFANLPDFWEIVRMSSSICFLDLEQSGTLFATTRELKGTPREFRDAFRDGLIVFIGAYCAMRLVQGFEELVPYTIPADFEADSPDYSFFVDNHTLTGLNRRLSCHHITHGDTGNTFALYGAEFGAQLAIELLASRYEHLESNFTLSELSEPAVFIESLAVANFTS